MMMHGRSLLALILLAGSAAASPRWTASSPVLLPGTAGSFDETAVKDPSIVRYGGCWHVFYTARGRGQYTLGYVSAPSLEGLRTAPRTQLTRLRVRSSVYVAAPQVFYFRPQKKWYLVFQTTDSNYLPVFSTTATMDRPDSWTAPMPLVDKQDSAKWIDFWVICDSGTAYLFFTRAHKDVVVMTSPIGEFPNGFRDRRPVFSPLIEAAHIYRERGGAERYLMLFEAPDGRLRRFGLATASSLAGSWSVADAAFATGALLQSPREWSRGRTRFRTASCCVRATTSCSRWTRASFGSSFRACPPDCTKATIRPSRAGSG
jgi:endo-1,4-beta-xylanase